MFIAKKIHSLLDGNKKLPEVVRHNVNVWTADAHDEWKENFPMITHIDTSLTPHTNALGVWRSDYQVSIWTKTKLEGRQIMEKILEILNRYSDAEIEACNVMSINNSYDQGSETNGLHARFAIIFREK